VRVHGSALEPVVLVFYRIDELIIHAIKARPQVLDSLP